MPATALSLTQQTWLLLRKPHRDPAAAKANPLDVDEFESNPPTTRRTARVILAKLWKAESPQTESIER